MRVHSVEAIPVEIPLGKNFGGSTYTVLKRCTVITRMRTDGGLVSEVYNGDNREHGREIARLKPQIAQHLIAAVPRGTYVECFADPERDPVWQAMWANRPAIKDGTLEVAQDPGFGLILDEGMVRRHRVA